MDTDKFLNSLTADEKGRIFSKLKETEKEYKNQKKAVYNLEFTNKIWLNLYENNKSNGLGTIRIDSYVDSALFSYLDGFNYENPLNVSLEETFNVRHFIRVLTFFRNNGWEFSNRSGYGYNFVKIFDQVG